MRRPSFGNRFGRRALAAFNCGRYNASGNVRTSRVMNRFERNLGFKGEARVRYLDGEVQVVTPGDFVRCAVTGQPIPLEELRYWSVELQEPYVDAATSLARFKQLNGR
jgi:hypothetical protein